jgi:hypothetical protein
MTKMKWHYHSFDPPEAMAWDIAKARYRKVTFPKDMENWYLPSFDPQKHGWKKGEQPFGATNGKLVGALQADKLFYAGCTEQLLMITEAGELVESVSASTGLPVPLEAIGHINNQVAVKTLGRWWLADLDRLDFSERAPAGEVVIRQLFPGQLPDAIRDKIPAQEQWLTWERLLLDLHSGRLLGTGGVVLVDGVGVLLGSLAMSGTAMWWLHRRRKPKS